MRWRSSLHQIWTPNEAVSSWPGQELETILDRKGSTWFSTYSDIQKWPFEKDNNCKVNVADGRNGTLASPLVSNKKGDGSTYEPNKDCQWTIDVGELETGEVVEITFDEFEIEGGNNKEINCPYDFLEISSRPDAFSSGDDKRRLCGMESPGILSFTNRFVHFRFKTDSTTQFKGFVLNWRVKSTMIKIHSYKDNVAYTVVTRPRTFEEATVDCENLGLQVKLSLFVKWLKL